MANAIAIAGIHILCIATIYSKPNKLENQKLSYLSCSFNKTSASVLFLGFQYEIFINKFQIILEFQYLVVSSFIVERVFYDLHGLF